MTSKQRFVIAVRFDEGTLDGRHILQAIEKVPGVEIESMRAAAETKADPTLHHMVSAWYAKHRMQIPHAAAVELANLLFDMNPFRDSSEKACASRETTVGPGPMPIQIPAPCWCPYCGEPHSPAISETNPRTAEKSEAAARRYKCEDCGDTGVVQWDDEHGQPRSSSCTCGAEKTSDAPTTWVCEYTGPGGRCGRENSPLRDTCWYCHHRRAVKTSREPLSAGFMECGDGK